jgi:hypothetical protein
MKEGYIGKAELRLKQNAQMPYGTWAFFCAESQSA